MSAIISSLSNDQRKKLLSLFNHAHLHLLYKASIHGFTAEQFHHRCDRQGPTITVAYNSSRFVFGGYTSKDYTQSNQNITDELAFLYSIREERNKPLRVAVINGQPAFVDGAAGPNFGALVFLTNNAAAVESVPGTGYNFEAIEMHGENLALTEFEVYRVEVYCEVVGIGSSHKTRKWGEKMNDVCVFADMGGLLSKPWRNIQWTADKRQMLKKEIQIYHPDLKGVTEARVLMVGPVGAGKSSFFNSINSVFRGNMTSRAIAGTAGKSVTTQFRTYTIKAGKGGAPVPLVLCDTMGLEESPDTGLDPDDVTNICKGHVQDRYQFSQSAPLQEGTPGYKKHVALKDKIHCVVYVVDTCKASLMSQKMLDKFGSIRKRANQMGIPQILIMTKIDEACPLVQENLKNVYNSVYIQKKARELSESMGIPVSCVVPVKNYSEELELDQDTDILLLSAVEHMLNYADSFFENQVVEQDPEVTDQAELYK